MWVVSSTPSQVVVFRATRNGDNDNEEGIDFRSLGSDKVAGRHCSGESPGFRTSLMQDQLGVKCGLLSHRDQGGILAVSLGRLSLQVWRRRERVVQSSGLQ